MSCACSRGWHWRLMRGRRALAIPASARHRRVDVATAVPRRKSPARAEARQVRRVPVLMAGIGGSCEGRRALAIPASARRRCADAAMAITEQVTSTRASHAGLSCACFRGSPWLFMRWQARAFTTCAPEVRGCRKQLTRHRLNMVVWFSELC